jgi:hypothetical protein
LASFLPLSLFPMDASMTQKAAAEKSRKGCPVPHRRPVPHSSGAFCRKSGKPQTQHTNFNSARTMGAPHLDLEMWESTNLNFPCSICHEHGWKTINAGDRPSGASRSCASSLQPRSYCANSYRTLPGRR